MLSDISWGQFISYTLVLLVAYGGYVIYRFYRNDVSNILAGRNRADEPVAIRPATGGRGSLMGSAADDFTVAAADYDSTPTVCAACGHVHGTPIAPPAVDSYGNPIVDTFPMSVLRNRANATVTPTTAGETTGPEDAHDTTVEENDTEDTGPAALEVDAYDPVAGAIDLDVLMDAIDGIGALAGDPTESDDVATATNGQPPVLDLFANDNLLHSEAVLRAATALDAAALGGDYSAVQNLEILKAA